MDADVLARARDFAARLRDDELLRELKADPRTVHPEARLALEEEAARRAKPRRASLIVTTTADCGRPVRRYLGIVGAEYVMGVNLFQEFIADVRDLVGGRSLSVQKSLASARAQLVEELSARAAHLRADAVLGVSFSLSEWSGQNKSMLVVIATGTAVELEPIAAA